MEKRGGGTRAASEAAALDGVSDCGLVTGAAHGRVCPMQDREMQGSLRPALRLSPHGAGGKGSPRTLTRFHRERESWDMNSGVHGPALLGWERNGASEFKCARGSQSGRPMGLSMQGES